MKVVWYWEWDGARWARAWYVKDGETTVAGPYATRSPACRCLVALRRLRGEVAAALSPRRRPFRREASPAYGPRLPGPG